MNVLQIIQEAAKRLCIMLPVTLPDLAPKNDDALDYDANLLVSCLNSVVKQMMVLNLFTQNIVTTSCADADKKVTFSTVLDPTKTYSDFSLNMTSLCPDFEELIGDGYTMYANGKHYLFRALTSQDYLRLARMGAQFDADAELPTKHQQIKEYKRNMPSETRTLIDYADNLESGFFMYNVLPNIRTIYFCNNIIPKADLDKKDWKLVFTYRSNYGVLSGDDGHRIPDVNSEVATTTKPDINNKETLTIPDELAIIGTVIKYKSYMGLEYTLEMGEQKALIDALKDNQEVTQITHLNKKNYYHKAT